MGQFYFGDPAAKRVRITSALTAGFSAQPSGDLALSVAKHGGGTTFIHVPLSTQLTDGDLLPRLAAARRLTALDETEARDLAVKYQLATEHTSFVVVAARADGEKATDLPATVAVPQMLAAGWGGSSTVSTRLHSVRAPMDAYAGLTASVSHSIARRSIPTSEPASISLSSFLSRDAQPPVVTFDGSDRRALLESLHDAFQRRDPMSRDLDELTRAGPVPEPVLDLLREAALECGADESRVVAAFLAWLESHTDTSGLGDDFLAMLRGQVAGQRGFRTLRKFLNERLER